MWRYEEDTRAKRQELHDVVNKRAEGLDKLKSQTQLCAETERFVYIWKDFQHKRHL